MVPDIEQAVGCDQAGPVQLCVVGFSCVGAVCACDEVCVAGACGFFAVGVGEGQGQPVALGVCAGHFLTTPWAHGLGQVHLLSW
jgi:hypothetical protein